MLKLLKGSYTATRGLVKLVGEGGALAVKGLDECNKGLDNLNFKLEKFNSEMEETRPFKKILHQLEFCRKNIELVQERTPPFYKNSHTFYDLSKEIIDSFIDINKLGIKHPNCRHHLQNLLDEFKNGVSSLLSKDNDWKAAVQQMYSNGLDENSNLLRTFCFYIRTQSHEVLEAEAEKTLPEIPRSLKDDIENFKRQIIKLNQ